MNQILRSQSEGICRVAELLLAYERYDQAAECLAVARLLDPTHPAIQRAHQLARAITR